MSKESILSIDSMLIIGAILILLLIVSFSALTYEEPLKEKFNVTTKAGEIYTFKTSHRCEKHLKKAAQQVYGMQDAPLSKVGLKMLPNIVKELTRIYDGNVKENNKCDILKLDVTPIKQIKPTISNSNIKIRSH